MSDTDMFHHADGDHAVKLPGEMAVVQLAKLDAIGNACGLGMDTCRLDLLG